MLRFANQQDPSQTKQSEFQFSETIDFASYLFVEPAEETNQEAILQELEFVVVNNEDLTKQLNKLIALRDRLIQHFTYVSERVSLKQPDVIYAGN